jgi:hypothetical protein
MKKAFLIPSKRYFVIVDFRINHRSILYNKVFTVYQTQASEFFVFISNVDTSLELGTACYSCHSQQELLEMLKAQDLDFNGTLVSFNLS